MVAPTSPIQKGTQVPIHDCAPFFLLPSWFIYSFSPPFMGYFEDDETISCLGSVVKTRAGCVL
ncbi:hypothetical protein OIU76_012607 [Salix suchowensis]|nr:hypothetical protein OIU76_012607 [Salix suchowensis]